MMFGTRVRYGITYKTNQPGFQIYTRKFYHNFKVAITTESYEGAKGCILNNTDGYLLAEKKKIGIYSQEGFKCL
jgi:hypothetical protein